MTTPKTVCFVVITTISMLLNGLIAQGVYAQKLTGFQAPSGTAIDVLGGVGGGLLDVYTIFADSESAAHVTAFELTFTGTFVQAQDAAFGNNLPSPLRIDVLPLGPNVVAMDTHFIPDLLLPLLPVPQPFESPLATGVPSSGFGDDLFAIAAISGPSQQPVVPIAQIVVPAGTSGPFGRYVGAFAVAGNPDPIEVRGVLGIPEPTTCALAIVGICMAFRRRF